MCNGRTIPTHKTEAVTQQVVMLRSCICTSFDRQCVPGRRVRRVRKAARFKGKPHPFPRQRAADCFRSPSTSYHVWTIIGNINVPTSLDGGGLYALRAGRCGCDSLSLAGSRQRVKSLRSSVRLRLVLSLLAGSSPDVCSISHPLHIRCAPVLCPLHSPHLFRGLADQRDCSFRS